MASLPDLSRLFPVVVPTAAGGSAQYPGQNRAFIYVVADVRDPADFSGGHDPLLLLVRHNYPGARSVYGVPGGLQDPDDLTDFGNPSMRAAAKREDTKSMLVAMTVRFKVAYRALGERLVEAGQLVDADQVFFLSHEEIGQVLKGELDAKRLTSARRDMLDYQSRLDFPEVFVGRGEPEDPRPLGEAPPGGFVGKAVSRGVAEGPARVVTRLEQLSEVQPGEILIARVVDVGWTPCFSIIGGLATEVGSAVSHGCVVARELGLPALVGLSGITQQVQSGQWVVLDADSGTLEVRADTTEGHAP